MGRLDRILLAAAVATLAAVAAAHEPSLSPVQANSHANPGAGAKADPNGVPDQSAPRAIRGPNLVARGLTVSLLDTQARLDAATPGARGQLLAQLAMLAHWRRDELVALLDVDPAEVLRIALPADVRSALPAQAAPYVEQQADETGELDVIHVDHVDPADNYYIHTLKTSRGTFRLHFAGAAPALESGAKVQVRGVRVDQSIVLAAEDLVVVNAVSVLSNTLGVQKTLVILVNFSNAPTQPFTPATASTAVFGTTSSYDYEASYQQTSLAGDVAGWFTIANPSTNCDYSAIASQAKSAASAAGYVLSNYRRLVYAFPSNTCSWWGLGSVGGNPSQAWIHSKYGFTVTVIGHEMGHNFGLYHSHSLDCGSAVVAPSGCTSSEYGDVFDIMGNPSKAPHFNAYQKERLGWLNAGVSPPLTNVPATSGTATYSIAPTEDARNTASRALKIPRGTACSASSEYFYVESRQAKGFDAYLSTNANVLGGVLVHKVTNGSVDSSYLLDMTPATASWSDPALVAGQTFTDPQTGLAISALSAGSTGALVSVAFPPSACTRAAPKMTVSPTGTVWTSAGSTTTYTLSVTNQDSCTCAATTFDVGGTVPAGWSATAARTASIVPGASASSALSVTVPAGTPANFYPVAINGTNSSASAMTTSVARTIAIGTAVSVAVASDSATYTPPPQPHKSISATITSTVTNAGSALAGAAVTVTVTDPKGSTSTLAGTTNASGVAAVGYTIRRRANPSGTYTVVSRATSGSLVGSGTTSFVVY
jgi:hypothetical protein